MPFRKLGERPIWSGAVVDVAEGRFRSPDGREFTRDLVHHPGAVAVVPVLDDGRAVLVRQYRAPVDAEVMEIPAGKRDVDGEPPEETARRELTEEVGLAAARIRLLAEFVNSVGFSDERTLVYLATGLTPADRDAQGIEEEHLVVEHVALADVPSRIADRTLVDAKTIIGLTLAAAAVA